MTYIIKAFLALILVTSTSANLTIRLSPQDITVVLDETVKISVEAKSAANQSITIKFENKIFVEISPSSITLHRHVESRTISLTAKRPGRYTIPGEIHPKGILNDAHLFVRLKIAKSRPLIFASLLIGWMYTAAWSIGYYPQMYVNYKRKNVEGLSFDFLAINIVGHFFYAIFNSTLFWNHFVEQEYFRRHPFGLNPVIGNDVGFACHATLATGFTIYQCFIYERGQQKLSLTAKLIIGIFLMIALLSGLFVAGNILHWLDFIYVLSYIKLTTTLIKYFPQAILNYRRQSTVGFSIENRLLDIAGGILGMLQMIINAYNYDDWVSIIGDPTKFGLGIFSILFDLVFMVQHYVLYREKKTSNQDVYKVVLNDFPEKTT